MWRVFSPGWYSRWLQRGSSQEARTIRLLYIEIFGAGVYNAIITFNGVYALRLGASNQLIGWLSSVPSLVVALFTLVAGQQVERSQNRLALVSRTVLIYRLGFLVIALMPFVVQEGRALVLVAIIILMAVPLPFINVGFNTVFADLVPTQRRSEVVSWRNIILGGTITMVAFLAGRGLDALPFPQNYQLLYFIAFLGGLQSQYFFQKIQLPGAPPSTDAPPKPPPRLSWTAARRLFQDHPGFLRITVNTFVYGIGPWMVTPLFAIYYVRELGASNSWVGALTGIINLTGILGYYLGRKVVKRWGERPVLAWSTILAGLYPGLITLAPILDPILVMGGLYGIANSGLNLSHYSTLLRVIPEGQRPMGLAFYNLIMFSGAFVAPVVSVALADVVGVRTMLIVGAAFWVTGGIMHLLRPAEAPPPLQAVEPPSQPVRQQVEAEDGHEEGASGDQG